MATRAKRITLVTDELLGLTRSAGAATANTFLAFALADRGHHLQILYPAPIPAEGVAAKWVAEYERRNIEIRGVPALPNPSSPATAAVTLAVHRALEDARPDVVVVDDRYGSCYASLRLRRLGLAFPDTLFVVYCHGTTAWIADAHRKVRRWPAAFEVELLERAQIELADVVVSPSAYMLDWMRGRGWRLAHALVVPLLTQSAGGEAESDDPIRRIAFFGRLEERKGLRPFLDALNALAGEQLSKVEIVFVGKETPGWTVERVGAALETSVATIRFETSLDQPEALELLRQPGTLAVMPSLLDNSPMVIYECLEHGIPFLASSSGGGPELVQEDDRARVFVEPTAAALERRLGEVLTGGEPFPPARAAFDTGRILSLWESVIATEAAHEEAVAAAGTVTAVIRRSGRASDPGRCLRALRSQSIPPDDVVVLEDGGIPSPSADFVFVLEDSEQADPDCLETLLKAQAASAADAVTCALRSPDAAGGVSFFHGDAGALGLVRNSYGLVGLYRGALADASNSDWLSLASLALSGRRIVSVPRALVRSPREPEDAASAPRTALEVAHAFERAAPPQLRGLPLLGASFAARIWEAEAPASLGRRLRWILAKEGLAGLLRRASTRLQSVAGTRSLGGGRRAATPSRSDRSAAP